MAIFKEILIKDFKKTVEQVEKLLELQKIIVRELEKLLEEKGEVLNAKNK